MLYIIYKIEKEDIMVDLKRENLEAYFEKLEQLSTEELDREAQKCPFPSSGAWRASLPTWRKSQGERPT